jgi:hypothetical protein
MYIFWIDSCNLLILRGLHKGRTRYRRSLKPFESRVLMTKIENIYNCKTFFYIFWIENSNLLILRGLHKGRTGYRSLHPSKKNIKTRKFFTFFYICLVVFALLDPDPDPGTHVKLRWIHADPTPQSWTHENMKILYFFLYICGSLLPSSN